MQNSFASTVFKVLTQIVLLVLDKAKARLSSFRDLKSVKRADACQCRRLTLKIYSHHIKLLLACGKDLIQKLGANGDAAAETLLFKGLLMKYLFS